MTCICPVDLNCNTISDLFRISLRDLRTLWVSVIITVWKMFGNRQSVSSDNIYFFGAQWFFPHRQTSLFWLFWRMYRTKQRTTENLTVYNRPRELNPFRPPYRFLCFPGVSRVPICGLKCPRFLAIGKHSTSQGHNQMRKMPKTVMYPHSTLMIRSSRETFSVAKRSLYYRYRWFSLVSFINIT